MWDQCGLDQNERGTSHAKSECGNVGRGLIQTHVPRPTIRGMTPDRVLIVGRAETQPHIRTLRTAHPWATLRLMTAWREGKGPPNRAENGCEKHSEKPDKTDVGGGRERREMVG